MDFSFGPAFWVLAAISVAAALTFGLFFLDKPPSLLRAAVKTLFMAALTGAFVTAQAPTPLVIVLAASALGDLFLAFDKKWVLPLGILSFLIAQLGYLVIFFALWMFSADNAPLWPRYAAMALIGAAALAHFIWLAPKLGLLALGVGPYALAIAAMAITGMWLPWVGWPAMLGVVLFLVSDGVLATELFKLAPDDPARRVTAPVVWWTYAGAQLLIVTGIVLVVQAGVA